MLAAGLRGRPRWVRYGLGALLVVALVAGLAWVYSRASLGGAVADPGRCATVARRYGLTPCPPDPVPLETVEIKNLDPGMTDRQAREIGEAYLRSRALYYLAITDNAEKFFRSSVIHFPDETPMMFDAEAGHIRDARSAGGRLVLQERATVTRILVVPLPAELRTSLGTKRLPLGDAVVVEARGPESQVIRVPGKPDQPVSTLAAGDSFRLLVGGMLLRPSGLGETFAELGQWECLDPDTKGACQS
jgi:hypothetical protein